MMATSVAAGGIASAMARFEASAIRTATGSLDTLGAELVEQSLARTAVSANVAVLRSTDDMVGSLLDILA